MTLTEFLLARIQEDEECCAAKRRALAAPNEGFLRRIAALYRSHPDYDESWR